VFKSTGIIQYLALLFFDGGHCNSTVGALSVCISFNFTE